MEYLLIAVGVALLTVGANYLVNTALAIGVKLKINPAFLGMVVLGFGTSLPELQSSVTASVKNLQAVAIGNVIGSNIFNVLFVLGVCALISNLTVKKIYKTDIAYLLITNIAFALFLLYLGINLYTGLVLIILFLASLVSSYKVHKNNYVQSIENDLKSTHIIKILLFAIVGFFGLFYGAELLINNSIIIANKLGLSQRIIGITVVAIGTSLPELATSVIASLKKQNDMAVYNIIGSNIFNISIIAGVSGVINPFYMGKIFELDIAFFALALVILTIIALRYANKTVGKQLSITMLVYFVIYSTLLFYK